MRLIRKHRFGLVQGLELGWSLWGPPLMTCYCYYLDGLLIDTGQMRMQAAVADFVAEHEVGQVVLTHYHEDHSGNAAYLKSTSGALVLGHPLTARKMVHFLKIKPYQHYIWGKARPLNVEPLGDEIITEHYRLLPLFTPGHSKDHTVYLEPEQGWLFSGDLYLGDRIKYFRSDERIAEQIASLKLVLEHDFEALFCAHHPRIQHGPRHLQSKLQYLEDLYGQVVSLWLKGYSPKEIMSRLKIVEVRGIKLFTLGNVSAMNMVRSVIKAEEAAKRVA